MARAMRETASCRRSIRAASRASMLRTTVADRVHHSLAPPPGHEARAAAPSPARLQGDAGAEFVELRPDQPEQGVEFGALPGSPTTRSRSRSSWRSTFDAAGPVKGEQEGLVAGEQVAALAGLGVLHR